MIFTFGKPLYVKNAFIWSSEATDTQYLSASGVIIEKFIVIHFVKKLYAFTEPEDSSLYPLKPILP
jgi:hypothetical protein